MKLPSPPEGYYWRYKYGLKEEYDQIQLVTHHWIFTKVHGSFYADTLNPEVSARFVIERALKPSLRAQAEEAIYEANTRRNQPLLKPKKGKHAW